MTHTFLNELANSLFKRYNGDMSSLVVMFSSMRARTFFSNALSECCDRPIWPPSWISIEELMEQIAGLNKGERILLVSELYKIYVKHHPNESFDKFYHWGEMLISDFDMIDKYLVDASQLLRNIYDIKELEADVSYLTPEQERMIMSFWQNVGLNGSISEHKEYFLKVWRSLLAIYTEYRARLEELGIGYTGMIYRKAAERIARGEKIDIGNKRYIIAGFNALSNSEKTLFKYLSNSDIGAEFYWDYDDYYTKKDSQQEAGMFMRDNIRQFPAAEELTHNLLTATEKKIKSIACVSNIAQCKYTAEILKSLPKEELDKRTAIVLTDESLLVPLFHSLPECVESVNVTMGYPFKGTLIHSFIERLIDLQAHARVKDGKTTFYHADATGILSHPYIIDRCAKRANDLHQNIISNKIIRIESTLFDEVDLLGKIFSKSEGWEGLSAYLVDILESLLATEVSFKEEKVEFIRIAADEILKTERSIKRCDIAISDSTYTSLLRRHLSTITIPYEGEPLEGIQIMGILETRNIDFKNVIILSMTDSNFPSERSNSSSIIPYNLRAAFGIPTPEEHEAMYAYYFYRLLQRAENVSLLYCSRTDEKSTGECSRYIYQLEYESPHKIIKQTVGVDLNCDTMQAIEVQKGEYEQSVLEQYLLKDSKYSLSPTSFSTYVHCPLKFYFRYIARIKQGDEISDTMDNLTFGNILHHTMEDLYKSVVGIQNPSKQIAELRTKENVERALDRQLGITLLNNENATVDDFTGDTLINREMLLNMIMQGIMRYDIEREGYTIDAMESDIMYRIPISNQQCVNLKGRADRIDTLADGKVQVIDYKSSKSEHKTFASIERLFCGKHDERIENVIQTLFYSLIIQHSQQKDSVPALFYAIKMINPSYSPLLSMGRQEVEHYADCADEFEQYFKCTLDEMFDYNTPFRQADDIAACKYCDYKSICKR